MKEVILEKFKLTQKDVKRGLKLPEEMTPKLAYICGILAGDGSIYKREIKHDYIIKCVGNPKDEKELYFEVIEPIFRELFGLQLKIKYHDSNTTFGFAIYSKTLFRYLTEIIELPSGKKYDSLKIPPKFDDENKLLINFIRGVFDTDGCISFKRRKKDKPYYPVISLSSKSKRFTTELASKLKELGFKITELYDYKVIDKRTEQGFTIINRIDMNGDENLKKWITIIGFSSPKHINKIKEIKPWLLK